PKIDARFLGQLAPDAAAILLRRPAAAVVDPRIHFLSEDGALPDIARRLFAMLRACDSGRWSIIHAEFPAGSEGLAPAIRDRLERAAARGQA
ncbi:MAG: translation factor Sua5, partial [Verrucomicrobia bacterium]